MSGGGQLCYEAVEVGSEPPALVQGPITTAHLVRWCAATENWHKIHYDEPYTREHYEVPGLLINGSLKQQFFFALLRGWVGRGGWVWKVGFQFRGMNLAGETLTTWARVTGKRPEGPRYGLVELELGIRNEAGRETTPARATVALPFRDGPPLPYPFVPPEDSA